jgi:hypothetical protein
MGVFPFSFAWLFLLLLSQENRIRRYASLRLHKDNSKLKNLPSDFILRRMQYDLYHH